jgi:hypothetical protein
MFMMGFSIRSFDLTYTADLTKGPQYFTVSMTIIKAKKGSKQSFDRTVLPLEPCTKEHWKMIPQLEQVYSNFKVDNWVCVPIGFPLPIEGTLVSEINQQISI